MATQSKAETTVVREGANPVAVFLTILVTFALGAGFIWYMFTGNPAIDIPTLNPFKLGSILSEPGDGQRQNLTTLKEIRCPQEVDQFHFKADGVIDVESLPQLRESENLICTERSVYENFLNLSGSYEEGGEKRSITGHEWLAKWYTRLSGNIIHFDEFFQALRNFISAESDTGEIIEDLVWIRLPGNGMSAAQDVKASATPFQSSAPTPYIAPTVYLSPTSPPTDTPIVIVPVVPTLVPVTPVPAVATAIPTEVRSEAVATAKADALAASCVSIVGATRFWDLDDLPIWNEIAYLEFRWGEDGLYAMSDQVGGNGPDAHRRKHCVRQVLEAPSNNLNLGSGITAVWNYAQVRKVPLYGHGDWKFNGQECGANGLWLFQCSAIYPTQIPPPTPMPPPVATPRASISLDELINLFIQNKWSMQRSCQVDGSAVLIRLGACELTGNPSYWVDFSPVWGKYQGGTVWVGPCIQLNEPKIAKEGNICISPFK
jgi:hypothetical protein